MSQTLVSGSSNIVSSSSKCSTVRTVIPKQIRESLDLNPKDKLQWNLEFDGKKLRCYVEKEI